MSSVNKVILVGNLGQDPDIRTSKNGDKIANLSIATSEKWRDKQSGDMRENTQWHRVVIFGKTAEVAEKFLRKGSQVYVEGQLETRKWQDQSGADKYSTEVILRGFGSALKMLGRRDGDGSQDQGQGGQGQSARSQGRNNGGYQSGGNSNGGNYGGSDFGGGGFGGGDLDDEIPF